MEPDLGQREFDTVPVTRARLLVRDRRRDVDAGFGAGAVGRDEREARHAGFEHVAEIDETAHWRGSGADRRQVIGAEYRGMSRFRQ